MAHRGRDTFVSRVRRVAKMPGWLRPEKPIGWYMDRFFDGETRSLAEDQFLCRYASLFDPAFCLAPTEEAMRFGLQDGHDVPRARYAGVTPFGAHGPWYGQTAERFVSKGDVPTTARECLYWGLLERGGVVGTLPRGRVPADALGGFDRVFAVTSSGGRREGTAATKERNRGVPLGG
jgi:hypothetical protein